MNSLILMIFEHQMLSVIFMVNSY